MTKIALVIARPDSSRLPDKHNRMIGNRTVMGWIIHKLSSVVDDVIISTTKNSEQHYEHYTDHNVHVYAPDVDDNNVLGRIKETAKKFKGKQYLIISGDCPLISAPIMKELLFSLMSRRYDAAMLGAGTSHVGADAITYEGIMKFEYGEHLSLDLVPNLNMFKLMILPGIYADFRATVDNFADLAFLRECVRMVTPENFTFDGVSQYIKLFPSIVNLNKHVSQKSLNFKTDKPNIAFITEGNDKIGMGHIARSIAMAQEHNECNHKHIHFYVNRNDMVVDTLEKYGYEYDKDYSFGLPVFVQDEFDDWEFVHDTYHYTTIDYDGMYRKNPAFAVNYRLHYVPTEMPSRCVVSFGKGKFFKYGQLVAGMNKNSVLLHNSNMVPDWLKTSSKVITVWSQTAREAIFLGKVPVVYSTNKLDDKLCKYLDKKGHLKWKGNLFKKIKFGDMK